MDLKQLKALIEAKVSDLGFSLESFSFGKRQGRAMLSLVVDREDEIDMETIVNLTRDMDEYLDEINPFDYPYTLDLCSLGVEKPLKINDLPRYVGKFVHVHLVNPIAGENIYEGDLVAVQEEAITLAVKYKTRVKNIELMTANIDKIRLAIKF